MLLLESAWSKLNGHRGTMAQEIERRFLVLETDFLAGKVGEKIIQGYIAKEAGAMTTRVRVRAGRAYLTLKGPSLGIVRDEFEYSIPLADARQMLAYYCGNRLIEKTRHIVDFKGQKFEVDIFHGRHSGLVVAEIELAHQNQKIERPRWLGPEITHDKRYGNFALASSELSILAALPQAFIHSPLSGVQHRTSEHH